MQVGCYLFASLVQFFLRKAACRADSPLSSTRAIPLLVLRPPSHHDAEDFSAKRFVYKYQFDNEAYTLQCISVYTPIR